MSRPTGKILAKIKYSSSINEKIENTIESQLREAQGKWKIRLSEEEKDLIRENAILQLKYKIREAFKSPIDNNRGQGITDDFLSPKRDLLSAYQDNQYSYDFSEITVMIKSKFHNEEVRVSFDDRKIKNDDIKLLVMRTSAGYIVAEEETEKCFPIQKLTEIVSELIFKWLNTAVYYGVASFAS